MMPTNLKKFFEYGIRILMALVFPFALVMVFGSEGSFDIFLPWSLWTVVLGGVATTIGKHRPAALRTFLWLALFTLAAWGTIVFFAITSYSPIEVYSIWLRGIHEGTAPKIGTYQIALLTGYATTMIALLSWFIGLRTSLLMLGVVFIAGLTVLTFWWPLLAGVVVILLILVFDISRGGNPAVSKGKSLKEALLLPVAALVLSSPVFFSRYTGASESPEPFEPLRIFADWYMHPGLWAITETEHGFGGSIGVEALPELNATPIFEVTAEPGRAVYLRQQIYDFYTGKDWQRFPKVLTTPAVNLARIRVDKPTLEAVLVAKFFPIVPHTLETEKMGVLRPAGTQSIPAQFMPEGIRLDFMLLAGDRIYFEESQNSPWQTEGGDKSIYLQGVPIMSPSFLTWLSEQGFAQANEPQEFVQAVHDYLQQKPYVLKIPGGEGTTVEKFLLQEGKGFSLHFATAAVMLARAKRIPARFVKGLFGWANSEGKLLMTAFHFHYWAEVYFPDTGWVTWDPSPPYQSKELMAAYVKNLDDLRTKEQLEVLSGERSAAATGLDWARIIWSWSFVWLLVAIPLFILGRDGWRFFQRYLQSLFFVENKLLRRLVRKSLKRTFPDPRITGWGAWINRWAGIKPWLSARLEGIIMPVLFSGRSFQEKDLKFLGKLRRLLKS